jgi:ribosomal protein S18 acetylase RimI-like enzyme
MNDHSKLILQTLREEDLAGIIKKFTFPWTSLQATQEKWERYYAEQQTNIRTVCITKIDDEFVGYGSLLNDTEYLEFKNLGIPEINDVWISEEYRGNGFGKKMIQYLEAIAQKQDHKQVGIGVGLYKDYGFAQKLYVRMGYIPDGNGATYKYQSVIPGDTYPVDDDLIIWFKKDLQ